MLLQIMPQFFDPRRGGDREAWTSPFSKKKMKDMYPLPEPTGHRPDLGPDFPMRPASYKSRSTNISEYIAGAVMDKFGESISDDTNQFLRYAFKEVETAEEMEAILRWSADPTASYSEMPPGAMTYELLVGVLPYVGHAQGARDVARDMINNEESLWTLLDAADGLGGAVGLAGAVVGITRRVGDVRTVGRSWRAANDLMQARPNLSPDEFASVLASEMGMTPREASRMAALPEFGGGRGAGTAPDMSAADIPGGPGGDVDLPPPPAAPAPETPKGPSMDLELEAKWAAEDAAQPLKAKEYDNYFTQAREEDPARFDAALVQVQDPTQAHFILRDGSLWRKKHPVLMHDEALVQAGLPHLSDFFERGHIRVADNGQSVEFGRVIPTGDQKTRLYDMVDHHNASDESFFSMDTGSQAMSILGSRTMNKGGVDKGIQELIDQDPRIREEVGEIRPMPKGPRSAGRRDALLEEIADLQEQIDMGWDRKNGPSYQEEIDHMTRIVEGREPDLPYFRRPEGMAPKPSALARTLKKELTVLTNPDEAMFLLPDGTMLGLPSDYTSRAKGGAIAYGTHADVLRDVAKSSLKEAFDDGIIRMRNYGNRGQGFMGLEIHSAPTPEQRQSLEAIEDWADKTGGGVMFDALDDLGVEGTINTSRERPEFSKKGWLTQQLDEVYGGGAEPAAPPPSGRFDESNRQTFQTGGMTSEMREMMGPEAKNYKPAVKWPDEEQHVTGMNHALAGRKNMKTGAAAEGRDFEGQYNYMERGFEVTDPETGKKQFMLAEAARRDYDARQAMAKGAATESQLAFLDEMWGGYGGSTSPQTPTPNVLNADLVRRAKTMTEDEFMASLTRQEKADPQGVDPSLAFAQRRGEPGFAIEHQVIGGGEPTQGPIPRDASGAMDIPNTRAVVYRNNDGKTVAALKFNVDEAGEPTGGIEIFVEPEYRGQNLSRDLYDFATQKGYGDLRHFRGTEGLTDDGARVFYRDARAGLISGKPVEGAEHQGAVWVDNRGWVDKPPPDRRAAQRGELSDEKIERAGMLLDSYDVPLKKTGAEPAHWEVLRRVARGEGGDVDLDNLVEVQEGFVRRQGGAGYEDSPAMQNYELDEAQDKMVPKAGADRPGGELRGLGAERLREFYEDPNLEVTDFDEAVAAEINRQVYDPKVENVGGTWQDGKVGKAPPKTRPYIVSPDKNTETIFAPPGRVVTGKDIAAFRAANAAALGGEHMNLGWWQENGEIYLDASRSYNLKSEAEAAMRKGDQMAMVYKDPKTGELDFIENEYYNPKTNKTELPDETYEGAVERAFDEGLATVVDPESGRTIDMAAEATARYISPQAAVQFGQSEAAYDRIIEAVRQAPSGREHASMAAEFQIARDWYRDSAHTLVDMFGEEAPRFTAVFASMSPRTTVQEDFKAALLFWERWKALPVEEQKDAVKVREIMDSIVHPKGQPVTMEGAVYVPESAFNNTMRALTVDDPVAEYLSGPKVNSFMNNLLNYTDAVTVDTHGARYLGLSDASMRTRALTLGNIQTPEYRQFVAMDVEDGLAGPNQAAQLNLGRADDGKVKDKFGGVYTSGRGYIAGEISTRAATDILNRQTPDNPWFAKDTQAAGWTGARLLKEAKNPEGLSKYELWKSGAITDDMLKEGSLSSLANKPEFQGLIQRAGGNIPRNRRGAGGTVPRDFVRDEDMREMLGRMDEYDAGNPRVKSLMPLFAGGLGSMAARQAGRREEQR